MNISPNYNYSSPGGVELDVRTMLPAWSAVGDPWGEGCMGRGTAWAGGFPEPPGGSAGGCVALQ